MFQPIEGFIIGISYLNGETVHKNKHGVFLHLDDILVKNKIGTLFHLYRVVRIGKGILCQGAGKGSEGQKQWQHKKTDPHQINSGMGWIYTSFNGKGNIRNFTEIL